MVVPGDRYGSGAFGALPLSGSGGDSTEVDNLAKEQFTVIG